MKRVMANHVYDILAKHCGATDGDWDREDFIHAHREGAEFPCHEYRFIGSLGFGGKFWSDPPMRVTCYREDETPDRVAMIAAANDALAALSP